MERLMIRLLTLLLLVFVAGWLVAGSFRHEASKAATLSAPATPELPRITLNTDYVLPTGKVIPVNAGGDFQAALNRALPGDVISLKAGAVFKGNFILPPKRGTGWIVIRSSTPDAEFPSPGTRVSPQQSGLMAKIITPNTSPAIATAPSVQHYRLIGLEIGIQAGVKTNYGIVALGDGSAAQNSQALVPSDLIVDRCYIHGNDKGDVSRGIALNSARTAVIDSYISECHAVGLDTQAICGWNGPGPFKIVNNYLEGAAENFMLGGADPKVPRLIPSDIEFRRNHLYKPLRWKADHAEYAGVHWSIKNLFELKNAQRVLIEGNVFEHNWADAQDGFALVWKSTNQDGTAPWSVTRDVTFVNNLIRHSGAGVNLLGRDTDQPGDATQRILIRNNLWEDIDGGKWGKTHGRFFQISDTPDVVVDHNTVLQTGTLITAYGLPNTGFVYTNNLSYHGEYGVKGDGAATGKGTIVQYFPGVMFARNVLVGGTSGNYPAGNLFPRTFAEVGVIDRSGDFRLTLLKPYLASGTDGKDIGCDLAALAKAIAGVSRKEM
ncbi:MAG: hypothetical protein SF097_01795 [Acidobacteriota bacterium]|nr:hypothetical protein [Acidobacteriota bacterium]